MSLGGSRDPFTTAIRTSRGTLSLRIRRAIIPALLSGVAWLRNARSGGYGKAFQTGIELCVQ
jgi:hypothetical protein